MSAAFSAGFFAGLVRVRGDETCESVIASADLSTHHGRGLRAAAEAYLGWYGMAEQWARDCGMTREAAEMLVENARPCDHPSRSKTGWCVDCDTQLERA